MTSLQLDSRSAVAFDVRGYFGQASAKTGLIYIYLLRKDGTEEESGI